MVLSSLPGAIVIAGLTGNLSTGNLRCPIGVGHDGNVKGMTRGKVRCPIGSGMTGT